MKKSGKREAAWVILFFLGYLAVYDKVEALKVLAAPGFIFVFGAFGMDWASKQTDLVKKRG